MLLPDEPEPVVCVNEHGASPFAFVSDHAGRKIPERLGTLGLQEPDLSRHIAWDIGIRDVTEPISKSLGAPYLYQQYSRLVIDCNRRPNIDESIVDISDGTFIPGNKGLSPLEVRERHIKILEPYHNRITEVLDRRQARGQPTVLISMHSCTPQLTSDATMRPWQIGVIAHNDWRVGNALIDLLTEETSITVGRNQPYCVDMEKDFTVPVYGEGRGLPYVEIEIRQDLISDPAGQRQWSELLIRILPRVLERLGVSGG